MQRHTSAATLRGMFLLLCTSSVIAQARNSTNMTDEVLHTEDNHCQPILVNGELMPTVPEYMPSFPVSLKGIKRNFVCKLAAPKTVSMTPPATSRPTNFASTTSREATTNSISDSTTPSPTTTTTSTTSREATTNSFSASTTSREATTNSISTTPNPTSTTRSTTTRDTTTMSTTESTTSHPTTTTHKDTIPTSTTTTKSRVLSSTSTLTDEASSETPQPTTTATSSSTTESPTALLLW
eukprot:XP_011666885.1 PREDICTED: integumentary mucin C.1-like [Strongylocentrotus purpuratus]